MNKLIYNRKNSDINYENSDKISKYALWIIYKSFFIYLYDPLYFFYFSLKFLHFKNQMFTIVLIFLCNEDIQIINLLKPLISFHPFPLNIHFFNDILDMVFRSTSVYFCIVYKLMLHIIYIRWDQKLHNYIYDKGRSHRDLDQVCNPFLRWGIIVFI